jgi:hypothetical protein
MKRSSAISFYLIIIPVILASCGDPPGDPPVQPTVSCSCVLTSTAPGGDKTFTCKGPKGEQPYTVTNSESLGNNDSAKELALLYCRCAQETPSGGSIRPTLCKVGSPPVPRGYIITDYGANKVKCPLYSNWIYTEHVIECLAHQPKGTRLTMCNGQLLTLPKETRDELARDWRTFDEKPINTIICSREPGDPTIGPTHIVIEKK